MNDNALFIDAQLRTRSGDIVGAAEIPNFKP